ncbi:pseudouridine synthase [Rheinheimera tilapiae]|uniref:Pseudouridine synthase n=1 Tax=Rheinheimera tilapiae TaxID=875043 RepID=A0ABV6BL64_9GAMM
MMSQLPRQRLWQRLTEAGIPPASQQALLDAGRLSLVPAATAPLKLSHWLLNDSTLLLDSRALPAVPPRQYWAYHKPVGVDCNVRTSDPHSIATILQHLPAGVFAIGRLDKDSCGLLLLSNDGAFAQRLLHPTQQHQKTYRVQVDQAVTNSMLQQLQHGLRYQAGPQWIEARPCMAERRGPTQLELTLTEGKNRQIRYMCRQLGLKVLQLQRIRIGALTLPDLTVGELQELNPQQVAMAASY